MRAVVLTDDRTLAAAEVPEPEPGPGEVVVEVSYCGICGSDLHAAENKDRFHPGYIMGHEIVGEVAQVGTEVRGWSAGDRVALYHATGCGTCEMCKDGISYRCTDAFGTSIGLGAVPGGYAERIAVPAFLLHRVPEHVDMRIAVLAEPLAIALHGINSVSVEPDDRICVFGAGAIGALTACALAARGHQSLVVVDPNPARRAMIENLGIAAAGLDDLADSVRSTLGKAPSLVFECSGNVHAFGQSIEVAATFGRVVLLGRPTQASTVSQSLASRKELHIIGAASCKSEEIDEAIEALGQRGDIYAPLITLAAPFEHAQQVFEALVQPDNENLKVLLSARNFDHPPSA